MDFIRSKISAENSVYDGRSPAILDFLPPVPCGIIFWLRTGKAILSEQLQGPGVELEGRVRGLPIVGMVVCGKPRFAQEDIEGYLQPEKIFKDGEDFFCLRATGDSMSGAGIIEGDLLVVRRQPQAQNGEIVVALIGDEATVKFLRRRNNRYHLEPANKKYRGIIVMVSTSIVGK